MFSTLELSSLLIRNPFSGPSRKGESFFGLSFHSMSFYHEEVLQSRGPDIWGSHARKLGEDISVISEKLGHNNITVTRRYLGITEDDVNRVEERVQL